MLKMIVELLISIIGAFVLVFIGRELNSEKKGFKTNKLIIIIVFGIILFCIRKYCDSIIKLIFINISLTMAVKLFLEVDYIKSIVLAITTYVILAIADLTGGILFLTLFSFDFTRLKTSLAIQSFLSISVYIIALALSKIKTLKKIVNLNFKYISKRRLLIIFYGFITIVTLGANLEILKKVPQNNIEVVTVYGIIIYLVYFITTIVFIKLNINLVKERERYTNKEKEYEDLKLYTNIIEELLDDRKKFVHDFGNVMLSLKGFIDDNDIAGLKKYYYDEVLSEKRKLDNKNVYLLKHIKNQSFKGLLTVKFNKCAYLGVNISFEIFEEINDLRIETVDLCRVVGILLDNAIEAAMSSIEKKIVFGIYNDIDNVSIIITNSFSVKPNIKKMFEKGYSSKGDNRGLGLYIAKEIIDTKYENIIWNTSVDDGIFIQEIIISKHRPE